MVRATDRDGGRWFLPTDEVPSVGVLLDLVVQGPRRLRPGDAPEPVGHPAHRLGELVVVRAGAVEHRDSLGHRGRLDAPAARLLSAGAGVLTEVGIHRDVRRDGGDVEVLTVRWAQGRSTTPTVRLVEDLVGHAQGRATITPLLGEGAGLTSHEGVQALHIDVPAGAGAGVAVAGGDAVVVAVLSGEVLVGAALTPVAAGHLAVLADDGGVVEVGTRLEEGAGGAVLVVAVPAALPEGAPAAGAGRRRGMVFAEDDADLDRIADAVASGAFGRLPSS